MAIVNLAFGMMMKRRALLSAATGLLFPTAALAQVTKQGADLDISPTNMALGPVGDTAICTVSNNGTAAATSQVRIKAWRQVGGQDVLEDTTDVVASPPFMTVHPGERQIVRVANLNATPADTELAYRVLVNQLPAPGSLTGSGVQVLLAFSVPLFIAGQDAVPPQLQAGFVMGSRGVVLRVTNAGDVHARLTNLVYQGPAPRVGFTIPGLAGYVLARSSMDLPTHIAEMPPPGGTLMIQTQFSRAAMPVPLTIGN